MPIEITGPDGRVHQFPDGTPNATINAQMRQLYPKPVPAQGGPGTPLAAPGQTPAGMTPSTMTAKPSTLLETPMPELSADAQRGQKMQMWGAVTGNKGIQEAGQQLLATDPTYMARKKQAEAVGEDAGKRGQMRLAGENILSSYAKLLHAFNEAPDETLLGAIGPRNTAKLQEKSQVFVPGFSQLGMNIPIPFMEQATTVDPATRSPIAGQITPVQQAAILNPNDPNAKAAWDLQNLFGHDVHGLTNAFMSNAPKGMNMSNERQAAFDSAMRDFMLSTNREEAKRVLDHAKVIIANDFNLTMDEADYIVKTQLQRFAQEAEHKALVKAAGNVPPKAISLLLEQSTDPNARREFNAKYFKSKPGLAEALIESYPPLP